MKKETTVANLIGTLVGPTIAVAAGGISNSMMPFVLGDKAYFGMPFEQVGREEGNILFWAYLSATILTPLLGYLYDIVGRFWSIIPAVLVLSFVLSVIHLSAPNLTLFIIYRSVMACLVKIIECNPLVVDYVKSESRGLAMAFVTLGIVIGELL